MPVPMKKRRAALPLLALLALLSPPALAQDRPQLRIINASPNPVEVFWLAPDGRRVSNGRIEPGEGRTIATTLGHRFAIVDGEEETEVESDAREQAYRYQVLGYDHPGILAAFARAQLAGNYQSVLSHDGRMVRHYALTNEKEYFAEGTEAFLYRNDFYPFVRAELKEHDPGLYELLAEIWEGKP